MRVVEFRDLELNMVALNHAGKIRWELILAAFHLEDDDPPDLPSGDDVGADLGKVAWRRSGFTPLSLDRDWALSRSARLTLGKVIKLPNIDLTWRCCLFLSFL